MRNEQEIDTWKDRNRGRKEKITRRKDAQPKGLHGEITRLQKNYTCGYSLESSLTGSLQSYLSRLSDKCEYCWPTPSEAKNTLISHIRTV